MNDPMTLASSLAIAGLSRAAVVPPADGKRRAAVAVVLDGDRVLLMVRATREGDPWSGHISLPGGGFHAVDVELRATAMRETMEELGIDLRATEFVGSYDPLHPLSSGPLGVEVTPFVFVVTGATPPEPVLGPEAVGAFWFPLDRAAEFVAEYEFTHAETQMKLPSWRFESHTIWGLTHRILTLLLQLAARPSDDSAAKPP
jgi:8-oxo-dGTP pyrophosphatase MutT (NUDIX family)